jgi:hypothetical protein
MAPNGIVSYRAKFKVSRQPAVTITTVLTSSRQNTAMLEIEAKQIASSAAKRIAGKARSAMARSDIRGFAG